MFKVFKQPGPGMDVDAGRLDPNKIFSRDASRRPWAMSCRLDIRTDVESDEALVHWVKVV